MGFNTRRTNRLLSPWTWFLAAITLGIAWRLIDAFLNFPIWGDEAAILLNLLERHYLDLLKPLNYQQVAPILYLVLEKGFLANVGYSNFILRLPAFLAGFAAIPMVYLAARQFGGRYTAFLATSLALLSLTLVRYTNMVKPYSIDLFLSATILYLGMRLLKKPKSFSRAILFLPLVPVSILLSYPSVFMIAAVGLVSGIQVLRRGSFLSRLAILATTCAAVSTFLPMYLHIGQGQLDTTRAMMEHYWRREFPPLDWGFPLWLLKAHTSAMFSYPAGGRYGLALLIFPLSVVGAVSIWRRKSPAYALMLILPFLFTMAAAFPHRYPYGGEARVEQHLAVCIFILAATGTLVLGKLLLAKLKQPRRMLRLVVISTIGFYLACATVSLIADIRKPYISTAYHDLDTLERRIFTPDLGMQDRVIVMQKFEGDPLFTIRYGYQMQPHLPAPRGIVTIYHQMLESADLPLPLVPGQIAWLVAVHGEDDPYWPAWLSRAGITYRQLDPPQMFKVEAGPENLRFPWVDVLHIQVESIAKPTASQPAP